MGLQKIFALAITVSLMAGCASVRKEEPKEPDTTAQIAELRNLVAQLSSKIAGLEGQLNGINGKVDAIQAASTPKLKASPVYPDASEGAGVPVGKFESTPDPEHGFISDEAVQAYRKAVLLLNAQKYSESVMSFSSFLEQYPDHPLAGSAQFHIGEAYYHEKEYKLALHEFRRVLTSYDRSPQVAETLRLMADCEDQLKMPQEAAQHRQQLTALFPQSPAAAEALQDKPPGTNSGAAPESGVQTTHPTAPASPAPSASAAPSAATGMGLDEPPPPTAPATPVLPASKLVNSIAIPPGSEVHKASE